MKPVILALLILLVSTSALAQSQYEELLRQDLRTMKTEVVTEAMALTEAEGKVFWPVYREYETELSKLWDERLELIRDYAAKFDTIDAETADGIATKALDLRDRREKLRRNYYKKFRGEAGAIIAARFMQVDSVLQDLVDLQIAGELPLVTGSADEMPAAH